MRLSHRIASSPQEPAIQDSFESGTENSIWSPEPKRSWTPVGESPTWELAASTLYGPAAVALTSSLGEHKALAEYLRLSGRPEPEKDAEWLASRDWGPLTPVQVAPFYVLGHRQYPRELENRDELIESTLEEVGKRLDWGMMKEIPLQERLELIHHLMEEIPVQPTETIVDWDKSEWDYGVMTYEALGRVGDLQEVTQYDKDQDVGFNVGTENWTGHFAPPAERPTRRESTEDYTRYLKMVLGSEGRRDPKRVHGDDHDALSCCKIVYNGFQRDPEKTRTFEELLGVTASPWASYGFTEMAHALPESGREEFQDHVIGLYRGLRENNKEEPLSQIDEERWLEPYIQWSYQVASLKPAEQTLADGLKEAEPQWREIRSSFPRYAHMEIYGQVNDLAQPGQSVAQTFQHYLDLNRRLGGAKHSMSGLYASMDVVPQAKTVRGPGESLRDSVERLVESQELLQKAGFEGKPAREMLQGLLAGTTGPVDGLKEALQVAGPVAAKASLPPKVMGQLLKIAMQDEHPTPERVQGLVDQYQLTGDLEGLAKVKERIESDLKAGILEGEVEELLKRFEEEARLQSLLVSDPEKVVKLAYDALAPDRAEAMEVEIDQGADYITIGGITLERM